MKSIAIMISTRVFLPMWVFLPYPVWPRVAGGRGPGRAYREVGVVDDDRRSTGSPSPVHGLVELEALAGDVIYSTKKAGQTLHIPLDTLYNNSHLRYITGGKPMIAYHIVRTTR